MDSAALRPAVPATSSGKAQEGFKDWVQDSVFEPRHTGHCPQRAQLAQSAQSSPARGAGTSRGSGSPGRWRAGAAVGGALT